MKTLTLECDCYHMEHSIRFARFEDTHVDDKPEVYVTLFLVKQRLLRRVWLGLKYIFGFKSQFGHFGETIFGDVQTQQLQHFLEEHHAASTTRSKGSLRETHTTTES
jgi:hypothetical protein